MQKAMTFKVIGLKNIACEGCEQRIDKALRTIPGVLKVRASSEQQLIEVLYDFEATSQAVISEGLKKLGYEIQTEVDN